MDATKIVDAISATIDMLAEKLGIAIDWTTENIMPTVMNVLAKYRTYEIVRGFGSILVAVICIIISIVVIKKMYKAYEAEKPNIFWDDWDDITVFSVVICVLGGVTLLTAVIGVLCNIGDLMKWLFVPELKYIELVKNFM